jgi:hypothetical protein
LKIGGYCKNKGLIYAIALIGFYRSPRKKKSVYKRGIDFICNAYEELYHEGLSKTEVRRLLRPHDKKHQCLKIPKKTLQILDCITSYIDIPSDGSPHKKCTEMKCAFCEKVQQQYLCCYYYLVYDMVKKIRSIEGSLDHNSLIYNIFKQIEYHQKKCGK